MFPLIFLLNSIQPSWFSCYHIFADVLHRSPQARRTELQSERSSVTVEDGSQSSKGFDPLLYCVSGHKHACIWEVYMIWNWAGKAAAGILLYWVYSGSGRICFVQAPASVGGSSAAATGLLSLRLYPFSTFHTPSNAPAIFATVHCSSLSTTDPCTWGTL